MDKRRNTESYSLHEGTNYRAYEYLGMHRGSYGCVFRVWAPHAEKVCLVGDFCDWNDGIEMRRINEDGIWECAVNDASVHNKDKYKYKIYTKDECFYRADPYAFESERQPADASVVCDLEDYAWKDEGWIAYRATEDYHAAINIYQLDLGAWRTYRSGEYFSYEVLARELAPYVKQMGYTHISITDAAEYVLDGWRTEVYSFFAPSSRFGGPLEFCGFVDSMHEAGIGVFVDFSISCFPHKALGKFDGQLLYEENSSPATGFDLSHGEVKSFLGSALCFWLERYHIDGFNISGMSKLVYPTGGVGRYIETVAALKSLYSYIKKSFSGVVMITDSPDFLTGVSGNAAGDADFDIMRNLPWTNYTLGYLNRAPRKRESAYHVTPEMKKIAKCNTLLAISCENVSGKGNSLIERAGGDYEQKFAGIRAILGHMIAYPGYKMTFMGSEFGQFRAWSRERELEWFLLDFEMHAKLQLYTAELNMLYLALPALHGTDFEIIDNERDGLFLCRRRGGGDELIIAVNLSDKGCDLITVPVSAPCTCKEIFNSDNGRFGGCGRLNELELRSQASEDGQGYINVSVPPLAISIFMSVGMTPKKRKSK